MNHRENKMQCHRVIKKNMERTTMMKQATSSRRESIQKMCRVWLLSLPMVGTSTITFPVLADDLQVSEEELEATYDNPSLPKAPEERSGLVVLRIAEVAQFQEKILRAIVSGELQDVKVAPMQFVYGTQILLKNSNLDGNMKLMIYNEIPRAKRKLAIRNAVNTMNELQAIETFAAGIDRDFEMEEMITLADMYRYVRVNLNQLYEYLPDREKEKYYGYFVAVTEYEKKIAEGTYNPDIDGVLNFDD